MHVALYINELFSVKRALNASAKSIDLGQPEQTGQDDLDQKFL